MKILTTIISLLLCVSCGIFPTTKHFTSDPKTERIVVDDVVYTPATHGGGSSTGFTLNGDISFSSISINTTAKYAVVFRCVHGKFIVEDSTIWAHSKERDTGVCIYREMYQCKYRGDHPMEKPQLINYQFMSVIFGTDTIIHKRTEDGY